MKKKWAQTGILPMVLCELFFIKLHSQPTIFIDTLLTRDEGHIFLNIDSPSGALYFSNSGVCGQSFSKIAYNEPLVKHNVMQQADFNGNLKHLVHLEQSKQLDALSSRMRMNTRSLPSPPYEVWYKNDPTTSTDLALKLGQGKSEIDLTGLMISNLTIQSALSDIRLLFTTPNLTTMKELEIHTAASNISISHAECARAEMISIKNDIGNTDVFLGRYIFPKSQIHIMSGTGKCTLRIHPSHPVKLIVKRSMLSSFKLIGEFLEVEKDVFTNEAYKKYPEKASIIICETDLGGIYVMEWDN